MNLTRQPIPQKFGRPAVSLPARRASEGADCTLRVACGQIIPGDTVGGHARSSNFAGAAQRADDISLIDGGPPCHHVLDHRNLWGEYGLGWDDVLRALMESQMRRRAAGIIFLKGEK